LLEGCCTVAGRLLEGWKHSSLSQRNPKSMKHEKRHIFRSNWIGSLQATTGNMAVFPGNNRKCKPRPSNLIG